MESEPLINNVLQEVVDPSNENTVDPSNENTVDPSNENTVDASNENTVDASNENHDSSNINKVVSVEIIKLTLIQLIQNALKNNDELKKININLSSETILFIEELLKIEPQLFEGIELSLKQIIKDNKVNSNDIPDLLVLITQVYEMINKHKNNIKNIDYYELVKNILHIIFRVYIEKYCDNDKLILIQCSLRIIDSSIELIKIRGFSKEKNVIKKILNNIKKYSCKC